MEKNKYALAYKEVIMDFALRITFHGNCAEAVEFYSDVFGVAPKEIYSFYDKRDILGDVPVGGICWNLHCI